MSSDKRVDEVIRTPLAVPKEVLVETVIQRFIEADGLDIRECKAGDTIRIETQSETFRLTILDPQRKRVEIQGEVFFTTPETVFVNGSTLSRHSTSIKLHWILLGCVLEIPLSADLKKKMFGKKVSAATSFLRSFCTLFFEPKMEMPWAVWTGPIQRLWLNDIELILGPSQEH